MKQGKRKKRGGLCQGLIANLLIRCHLEPMDSNLAGKGPPSISRSMDLEILIGLGKTFMKKGTDGEIRLSKQNRTNRSRSQTAESTPDDNRSQMAKTTANTPLPMPAITKIGLQRGTMAISPRRPLRHCPRQRLLKPTYRGA